MSHWNRCVRDVLDHADHLAAATKKKRYPLRISACEGLMETYLEQPAFDRTWRKELFQIAMNRISERTSSHDPALR